MTETTNIKIAYPLDVALLQRRQKKLRRTLKASLTAPPLRVAILGGSTTSEVANYIELFLLNRGVNVEIYQSDYNQFYQEALFDNDALDAFNPQVIYLHTSSVNLTRWPVPTDLDADVSVKIADTFDDFHSVWQALHVKYQATIIQNNFELPFSRPLGNIDASAVTGKTRFTNALNARFAEYAEQDGNFILHDLNYLSAWFGLERWFNKTQWFAYKYAMSSDAFPELGHSVANQILAVVGLSKKAIVCDLDNTLWGGVIGDDGLKGIQIGHESAEAEAYTELQQYLKALHQRGVLLTVCSKNDIENAKQGFSHPDSILTLSDFSEFKANWENKDQNIEQIAESLNIGLDSLVFLDDNASERALVASNLSSVAVPNIGQDVTQYITALDKAGWFELVSLNPEDVTRAAMYAHNQERQQLQCEFENYDDYLRSLDMHAMIAPFDELALPRITQLTNKTNQFNLTTQRYSAQEMTSVMHSPRHLSLYGRLRDKFGDNGIVSVIVGAEQESTLTIDLWLMSCRVFKRKMEQAMFAELVRHAKARNLQRLVGRYVPSKKNGLVSDHYASLGFQRLSESEEGSSQWEYVIDEHQAELDLPLVIMRE
ncbi:FkbH like protein [Enterovibrio norvegicus FF-33]|uniref:HAD-IIIC family phosphatase n=1 Tax=Enterovibrio norvegicus TaxID=188144 RepID=UPI0002F1C649|nr:HAD-IIIC family phosphatase [Enterovibrio norvegicus]OEE67816.1 FkbH like protein [Enterovibrio norvegicus FF-33]